MNNRTAIHATFINGFYGSGKSTFADFLISHLGGKNVALILNSVDDLSDGDTLKNDSFDLYEINHGSIREGAPQFKELIQVLQSKILSYAQPKTYDYVIVETGGDCDPYQVVQLLHSIEESQTSNSRSLVIDSFVTIVDRRLLSDIESCDQRITKIVQSQIKTADIVILNKSDVSSATDDTSKVHNLNPGATVVQTAYGDFPVQEYVLYSGRFDYERYLHASQDPSSRPPSDEPLPSSITSFVYRSKKPFHPKRLSLLIQKEVDQLQRVIRSKGCFWLASRWQQKGIWNKSYIGPAQYKFEGGENWDTNNEEKRNEMVFVGLEGSFNPDAIQHVLDACLLNNNELLQAQNASNPSQLFKSDDNLPAWDPPRTKPTWSSLPDAVNKTPELPIENIETIDDFVSAVQKWSANIYTDSKNLVDLVIEEGESRDENAADVINTARDVALKTSHLVDKIVKPFVKNVLANGQHAGIVDTLLNQARDVRDTIRDFIRASKTADSNPLDVPMKQKVNNSLTLVKNSIKHLLELMDQLKHNKPGVASPPGTGADKMKRIKEEATGHAKAMALAIKNADAAVREYINNPGKANLEIATKEFIAATKLCVDNNNKLRHYALRLGLQAEQENLKETVSKYVACGKELLGGNTNALEENNKALEQSKRRLAEAIKESLIGINTKIAEGATFDGTPSMYSSAGGNLTSASTNYSTYNNSTLIGSGGGIPTSTANPVSAPVDKIPNTPMSPVVNKPPAMSRPPPPVPTSTHHLNNSNNSNNNGNNSNSVPRKPTATGQGNQAAMVDEIRKKVGGASGASNSSKTIEEFNPMVETAAARAERERGKSTGQAPADRLSLGTFESGPMLEKIIAVQSYHAWRASTMSKSANRKLLRIPATPETSDGNTEERLRQTRDMVGESIVEFIATANAHSLSSASFDDKEIQGAVMDVNNNNAENMGMELKSSTDALYSHLKNTVRVAKEVIYKCYNAPASIRSLLECLITTITDAPTHGKAVETVLEASKFDKRVEGYQRQLIFQQSKGILTLALQTMAALNSLLQDCGKITDNSGFGKGMDGRRGGATLKKKMGVAEEDETQTESTVVFLIANIQTLIESIEKLLNLTETAKEILDQTRAPFDPHGNNSKVQKIETNPDEEVNIWDDLSEIRLEASSTESSANSSNNSTANNNTKNWTGIAGGTLNKLVEKLTSHQSINTRFLQTFITTYQSFTTPEKLFSKLLERFYVKPGTPEEQQIKLRVCVVLQYWVGHQFFDFDDDLLKRIFDWIPTLPKKENETSLSDLMSQAINSKINERKMKLKAMFIKPQELKSPDNVKSIMDMFTELKDTMLAQQLTIVDWAIFSTIEPSELLNQAWNTPKYYYRSPNVIAMIQRANKLSHWVCTMILAQPTSKGRRKMYEKFMGIALELRKLNNYHTMMGIIAGLNTSAINRLATMKGEASSRLSKQFKRLEEIMNPKSAFSVYRGILHESSPPLIPYLGVYLTDLTFIEDGNPDELDDSRAVSKKIINFAKRELVYRVIEEIKQYQLEPPTEMKAQEPVHTFLAQLPMLSEKEMYELSLVREPRKPQK